MEKKTNLEKLISFLGNDFIMSSRGKANAEQTFKDVKFIGLLFSADYTPPCKSFVKKYLIPFYKEVNDESRQIEIIYISLDKNFNDYRNCFVGEMPWYALKYNDMLTEPLMEKYSVKCIPTLIVINPLGELVTDKGRTDIMVDEFEAFNKWVRMLEKM